MGRPKKTAAPAAEVVLDTVALTKAAEAANELSVIEAAVLDTAELYKLVGRIEVAHFTETVSGKLMAQAYLKAKEEFKKINSLAVTDRNGQRKHVSGLEEFCDAVMPISARRCRQIVEAIGTLGEELYEQAERIGFRARDYQALRALPADDQEVVKQALTTESREQVIDLLTELAARNQQLRQRVEQAADDLAAKDDLIGAKNKKIDDLLARKRFKPGPDDIARTEREKAALDQWTLVLAGVDAQFAQIDAVVRALYEQDPSPAIQLRVKQGLEYVVARLAQHVDELGLEVDLARLSPQPPDWLASATGQGSQG
ncbi:MAG: hypothetical protein KF683_04985 [Rubrivivax sp.]|nr:hypothetical protein [Rubrivivax sp.]